MFSFIKDVPPFNIELIKQGIWIIRISYEGCTIDMYKVHSFDVRYTSKGHQYILNECFELKDKDLWTTDKFVQSVSKEYLLKHARNYYYVHTNGRDTKEYRCQQQKFCWKNKIKYGDLCIGSTPIGSKFIGIITDIHPEEGITLTNYTGQRILTFPYTNIRKIRNTNYDKSVETIFQYCYDTFKATRKYIDIHELLLDIKRKNRNKHKSLTYISKILRKNDIDYTIDDKKDIYVKFSDIHKTHELFFK